IGGKQRLILVKPSQLCHVLCKAVINFDSERCRGSRSAGCLNRIPLCGGFLLAGSRSWITDRACRNNRDASNQSQRKKRLCEDFHGVLPNEFRFVPEPLIDSNGLERVFHVLAVVASYVGTRLCRELITRKAKRGYGRGKSRIAKLRQSAIDD